MKNKKPKNLSGQPAKRLELYYPLDRTRFTQHFGQNPDYYLREFGITYHNGIDMTDMGYTGNGAAVYAAHDGVVLYTNTDWNEGLGVGIRTLEPYDYEGKAVFFKTLSWHLLDIKVSAGQRVTIGQLIGHVDNTGKSTAPHLHFGLKPIELISNLQWKNILQDNGVHGAIDPMPYLLFPSANQVKKSLSLLKLSLQKFSLALSEFIKNRKTLSAKKFGSIQESKYSKEQIARIVSAIFLILGFLKINTDVEMEALINAVDAILINITLITAFIADIYGYFRRWQKGDVGIFGGRIEK